MKRGSTHREDEDQESFSPRFRVARNVECPKPAHPLRPRNQTKKDEVVSDGVGTMSVDEGVEAEQRQAEAGVGEPISPQGDGEAIGEAAEEDVVCQECVEPRILPDPEQPRRSSLKTTG